LKATPRGQAPTIGYLAGRLLLKHHSAVGLVDRLESLGLVRRATAREDARQVLIRLTVYGNRVLRRLSLAHRIELEQTGPALAAALRGIGRKKHS
jgi:DNA-binding MarR family transcriptional regulator